MATLLLDFHNKLTFCERRLCLNNVMIIAVWAVLVSFFEFTDLLAESSLALLAEEDQLHGGQ